MKKLGVLVMALVFILSASVYSFADERVTFNGQYQATAIMNQNADYGETDDNDQYFWYQRFRLPVTFNISEAVSAHLRMDISEGTWGDQEDFGTSSWVGPTEDAELGIDRAFISIAQDMYSVKVGQHYNGVGNYLIWDQQRTGITMNLDLPVNVTLNYSKVNEGHNTTATFTDVDLTDDDTFGTEDTDFYGVNLGYDQDMWNINALFAMQKDYSDNNEQSPYAIGVYGAVALDLLTFSAEIDMLGGDDGNNDYKGLQGFFDVAFDMNDMLTTGGSFYYAKGYDDADETQIASIAAGGGTFDPLGFGGNMNAWLSPISWPWKYGSDGIFDASGDGAGVIGGRLYADAALTDKLDAYLRLGYLTPQDDDMTEFENVFTATGNVAYQWLPSTTLSAGMGAVSPDYDDNTDDDTKYLGFAQISVDW